MELRDELDLRDAETKLAHALPTPPLHIGWWEQHSYGLEALTMVGSCSQACTLSCLAFLLVDSMSGEVFQEPCTLSKGR